MYTAPGHFDGSLVLSLFCRHDVICLVYQSILTHFQFKLYAPRTAVISRKQKWSYPRETSVSWLVAGVRAGKITKGSEEFQFELLYVFDSLFCTYTV